MERIPTHPGELIRHECLEARQLTVAEGAEALGVPVERLRAVLDQRAPVDADLAQRLERVFGSTAQTWLRLQLNHDRAERGGGTGESVADRRASA